MLKYNERYAEHNTHNNIFNEAILVFRFLRRQNICKLREKSKRIFPTGIIPGDITMIKTSFSIEIQNCFFKMGQITSTRIQRKQKELSK